MIPCAADLIQIPEGEKYAHPSGALLLSIHVLLNVYILNPIESSPLSNVQFRRVPFVAVITPVTFAFSNVAPLETNCPLYPTRNGAELLSSPPAQKA